MVNDQLNPPESAPKDQSMILIDAGYPVLVAAMWNEHEQGFSVAVPQINMIGGRFVDPYFESDIVKDIRGWLPWPDGGADEP